MQLQTSILDWLQTVGIVVLMQVVCLQCVFGVSSMCVRESRLY